MPEEHQNAMLVLYRFSGGAPRSSKLLRVLHSAVSRYQVLWPGAIVVEHNGGATAVFEAVRGHLVLRDRFYVFPFSAAWAGQGDPRVHRRIEELEFWQRSEATAGEE
ncbi:MAG: hypothetical protein HY962_07040 [Ignavibacteriae bacterium]|nr:hypothetical protein [Ignavibacteriota bacterium]